MALGIRTLPLFGKDRFLLRWTAVILPGIQVASIHTTRLPPDGASAEFWSHWQCPQTDWLTFLLLLIPM